MAYDGSNCNGVDYAVEAQSCCHIRGLQLMWFNILFEIVSRCHFNYLRMFVVHSVISSPMPDASLIGY